MKKFYIEVTEIYQHTYAVEAEDLDEAMQKVEDAANDGTIDINYEDFISRDLEDRTKEVETYDKEIRHQYDTLTDEGVVSPKFDDEEE